MTASKRKAGAQVDDAGQGAAGGRVAFTLTSDITPTPRVLQVAAMFDVPLSEATSSTWDLDVPLQDRPWQIGLIVGPSGSGKTSVARRLWPEQLDLVPAWTGGALVEEFPENMSIRDVTGLLCSTGLSSPPAWLRPFSTLSNGEAFRAVVARALAQTPAGGITVMDEFTSVVDRQVAQVASHCVQKQVRSGDRRFVAVTCHYDVQDWLQADWVLDMATGSFTWRTVQSHPPVSLQVHPVDRSIWRSFARHHYLTADIHRGARCFAAFTDAGDPVAFGSYLHFPHPATRNLKVAHRLVTLPDWQGLGIGMRVADWMGQHLWDQRLRLHLTSAHPAVIGYCGRSPRWKALERVKVLHSAATQPQLTRRQTSARTLNTRGYEYRAPAPIATRAPAPT